MGSDGTCFCLQVRNHSTDTECWCKAWKVSTVYTPNKAVAPHDVLGILAYITQSIQLPAIIQSTHNPRAPGPYFGPLPLELPWRPLGEEHGGVCRGEVRVLEQTAFAKTLAPQGLKVLGRNARASWGRRLRRERAGLGGLARTDTYLRDQGTRYIHLHSLGLSSYDYRTIPIQGISTGAGRLQRAKSKSNPLSFERLLGTLLPLTKRATGHSIKERSGPYRHSGLARGNCYFDLSHLLAFTRKETFSEND